MFTKSCTQSGVASTSTQSVNTRWSAPELLHNVPASTNSDVWSFGMVCLELLSGEVPYSNVTRDISVLLDLDKNKLPQWPEESATRPTDQMRELISTCWRRNPESRPSISSLKSSLMEMNKAPSVLGMLSLRLRGCYFVNNSDTCS